VHCAHLQARRSRSAVSVMEPPSDVVIDSDARSGFTTQSVTVAATIVIIVTAKSP
jgi:hypothetical protein